MKRILDKFNTVFAFAASISIVLILLISSIQFNSFDRNFYKSEYKKLNTAAELGMTEEDLFNATNVLLDYLQEKRDDISIQVSVRGTQREAFNAKETSHMADVRGLYQFALNLRLVCFGVFAVSVIYLAIRLRKGIFTELSIHFIKTAIGFGIFFIFLAGWAYVDFNSFWTTFHQIAFRNDLWLLNPATDLMINLFPSAFFSKLVFHIIAMLAVGFAALFGASYFYLRHQLKLIQGEVKQNEAE